MVEKRIEVRIIMVRLMCDKCGEGEMKPTGFCLTSSPPQYPHKCDKCGSEVSVRGKTYPSTEYEEVTQNAEFSGERSESAATTGWSAATNGERK